MSSHLPVDDLVLIGAAIVVIGVLTAGLAERFRLPSLLVFLALGMVVADDGLGLIRFDDAELAQSVAIVALVVILFEGGLSTPLSEVRAVASPAILLATVAVVVTAALVAGAAFVLLDVSATTAWLIGAVVASTDAAAVLAVMRDAPIPRRLATLLEAESGMNDPVAVLLTVGVLETWRDGSDPVDWFVLAVRQLGGGAVVGIVVGAAGAWLANRIRLGAPLRAVLGTGLAGLGYGVAVSLGASGLLAVYLIGLVLASRSPRHRHSLRTLSQGFAAMAQIALFLLLGLLVFPSDLTGVAAEGAAIAAVLALVARPVAVGALLPWFGFGWRELTLVAWAGLRGAVPIVLATFPLTFGQPDGDLIFDLVFFVVIISVALQGPTIPLLARALGLAAERGAATSAVVPIDVADADVIEVELEPSAAVLGRTLRDAPMPAGIRVSVLVREGETVIPDGDTVLAAGDLLVVVAHVAMDAEHLLADWAAGRQPV
jgi:cell volume regulation protein A